MPRRERVAIALVLLLAAALRLWGIGAQSLWFDEAATVHIVRQPLPRMFELIRTDERTPPLHYVILHAWVKVFGHSEASVRLPSAIAGVAAVFLMYRLVRRLFGPFEGVVAAFLLAVSNYQIGYSQEARAYSLMLLLALWSCDLFVGLLRRRTSRTEAAYVVVTALLLYTHLYGVFAIAAQHVAFWCFRIGRRASDGRNTSLEIDAPPPIPQPSPRGRAEVGPARWLLLNVAVATLFAPWAPTAVAWTRSVATAEFWAHQQAITWMDIVRVYRLYSGSFTMLAVLLVFLIVGVVRARERWRLALPAALMLLPVVVPVAVSVLSKPTFADRYGLVAPAGLYALAAVGVSALRRPAFQGVCVALLGVLAATSSGTGFVKPDWRGAGAFLNANLRGGDVVVVTRKIGATYLYDYYVPRRPDVRRIGFDGAALPISDAPPPPARLWLVIHSDVMTIEPILARGPWRVIEAFPFRDVDIYRLEGREE